MQQNISIIGAGLVGSLLSIFLAKRGYKIDVFEKRHDSRKSNLHEGRSINLALSTRGINALAKVGMDKKVLQNALPVYGRMIHHVDGSLDFQPYTSDRKAIYSVSRGILNEILLNEVETYAGIKLHFDHKCIDVDFVNNELSFLNSKEDISKQIKSELVFGADGAFSALREAYKSRKDFTESVEYLNYGYKELHIPALPDNKWALNNEALHIWPRKNFMLMALPNLDGSFTCTLFLPFKGETSFETIEDPTHFLTFFLEYFPDTINLIPHLEQEYYSKPVSSLVTVRCFPWTINNRFSLIGDAAHALLPFYGQGMNCGFEDCFVLDMLIEKYNDDWVSILGEYNSSRKINTDAITQMALENFIEMRDLVADPEFLKRKKVEAEIKNVDPEWKSKYEMVTFSDIPYAETLQKSERQNQILDNEVLKLSLSNQL